MTVGAVRFAVTWREAAAILILAADGWLGAVRCGYAVSSVESEGGHRVHHRDDSLVRAPCSRALAVVAVRRPSILMLKAARRVAWSGRFPDRPEPEGSDGEDVILLAMQL
jgi:hypothetical protein